MAVFDSYVSLSEGNSTHHWGYHLVGYSSSFPARMLKDKTMAFQNAQDLSDLRKIKRGSTTTNVHMGISINGSTQKMDGLFHGTSQSKMDEHWEQPHDYENLKRKLSSRRRRTMALQSSQLASMRWYRCSKEMYPIFLDMTRKKPRSV